MALSDPFSHWAVRQALLGQAEPDNAPPPAPPLPGGDDGVADVDDSTAAALEAPPLTPPPGLAYPALPEGMRPLRMTYTGPAAPPAPPPVGSDGEAPWAVAFDPPLNAPQRLEGDAAAPLTVSPAAAASAPGFDPASYEARVRQARHEGDSMRLSADLGKAGAMAIGALTNTKVPTEAYDALAARAGAPEMRAKEELAFQKLAMDAAKARALSDPNSPANVAYRAQVASIFPEFAKQPGFGGMTQGSLERLLPVLNTAGQQRAQQTHWDAESEARKADGREKAAEFERTRTETERHNRATEARLAMIAEMQSGQAGLSPIDVRKNVERLDQLGKAMANTKLAELDSSLRQLDTTLPGITNGHVPKGIADSYGVADRLLLSKPAQALTLGGSTRAVSGDALRVDQAREQLVDLIKRLRSGAVLNAQEEAYYNRINGGLALSDPRQIAEAARFTKALIGSRIKALQAPLANSVDPRFNILGYYEGPKYTDAFYQSVLGAPAPATQPPSITLPQPAPAAGATPPPAPAPAPAAATPPPGAARKQYSPSRNVTRWLDAAGNVIKEAEGKF